MMKTGFINNKGAALVTSLILLLALTMVALSAIQTSAVQVQISGNDEDVLQANQFAQSIVDAVIETPVSFVVGASSGYTVCTANAPSCDKNSISFTDTMFSVTGGYSDTSTNPGIEARVKLIKTGTAPRMGSKASSATAFSGAYFTVQGSYNEIANNGGKASVVQGFVMIYPKN